MWAQFGLAVVEENTNVREAALDRLAAWEYGPGTGAAFLVAEARGLRSRRRGPFAFLVAALRMLALPRRRASP